MHARSKTKRTLVCILIGFHGFSRLVKAQRWNWWRCKAGQPFYTVKICYFLALITLFFLRTDANVPICEGPPVLGPQITLFAWRWPYFSAMLVGYGSVNYPLVQLECLLIITQANNSFLPIIKSRGLDHTDLWHWLDCVYLLSLAHLLCRDSAKRAVSVGCDEPRDT